MTEDDNHLPPEESEYELRVPFVVCQSEGGIYEDDAFCAGYTCGWVHEVLGSASPAIQQMTLNAPIPRNLEQQLDLQAMDLGWTMVTDDCHENEQWMHVTFSRTVEHP